LDIVIAIILGIVEGITEFLPISSTGHLILVGAFLDFKGSFAVLFSVVIQLGAILAVVFFYKERIIKSLSKLKPGQEGFQLWSKVVVATLPALVFGLLFDDYIEEHLFSPAVVSVALVIGAILMLLVGKNRGQTKYTDMQQITYKAALIVGFAQCMAMIPGMSRSASTIIGGVLIGMSLASAAEFSFFLAIPLMFGATFLTLSKGVSVMTPGNWVTLAIGFIVSFIVAYIVIGKFIPFLQKHGLKPFAYYRIVLGGILILCMLAGVAL
jgi:undecaprenyl-diphosphatase